ncbi:MAG: hypothetical protein M3513_18355 [Actinomycetota bacterium]|nr:hypothetical protein [Actinomycetota bacterium]
MKATRVLFIAGLGRSGTTLIERVLDQLPGVCSAGELIHLWRWGILDDERCGCGEPFSTCGFWTAVGRRAFGVSGWTRPLAQRLLHLRSRVDRARYVPQLSRATSTHPRGGELAAYLDAYRDVYAALADVSGASVVVDSSKQASLAYCLRHDDEIDVRVVHVVRDSRGVAYSWTKEMARPEAAEGRQLMTRYSPVRSALLWDANNASPAVLGRLGRHQTCPPTLGLPVTPRQQPNDCASSGNSGTPAYPTSFTSSRLMASASSPCRSTLPMSTPSASGGRALRSSC